MPEFSKIVGVTFSNEDGTSRQDIIEDLEEAPQMQVTTLTLKKIPKTPMIRMLCKYI